MQDLNDRLITLTSQWAEPNMTMQSKGVQTDDDDDEDWHSVA